MLEQPAEHGRIAGGIAGASDGIEREANAKKSPDSPMRDAVAEEVEEEPSCDHGGNGGGFRVGGSGQGEKDTSRGQARDLNYVSIND